MNSFEKNITFVIVSFRSGHIIEKCIKSINPKIKIIIVENSNNIQVKDYLENKFLNVQVIIANKINPTMGSDFRIINLLKEFYKIH